MIKFIAESYNEHNDNYCNFEIIVSMRLIDLAKKVKLLTKFYF